MYECIYCITNNKCKKSGIRPPNLYCKKDSSYIFFLTSHPLFSPLILTLSKLSPLITHFFSHPSSLILHCNLSLLILHTHSSSFFFILPPLFVMFTSHSSFSILSAHSSFFVLTSDSPFAASKVILSFRSSFFTFTLNIPFFLHSNLSSPQFSVQLLIPDSSFSPTFRILISHLNFTHSHHSPFFVLTLQCSFISPLIPHFYL